MLANDINIDESNSIIYKLDKMNIEKIGDFVHVSYDSPYKFYNRRNEVIIKVSY